MSKEELKPCAHCGGEAELKTCGDSCWLQCECCGIQTDEHTGNLKVLYYIWNARDTGRTYIEFLEEKIDAMKEIITAVAHVGVDFGYGCFELTHEHIENARGLLEKENNDA